MDQDVDEEHTGECNALDMCSDLAFADDMTILDETLETLVLLLEILGREVHQFEIK